MGGWRNANGCVSSSSAKSNGTSNGITTVNGKDFYYSSSTSEHSRTVQNSTAHNGTNSPVSPIKNPQNPNEENKLTCSLIVTLHKNGIEQPSSVTKTFVYETSSFNLSPEELERLEFRKMSFDLKVEEARRRGSRKLCEGISEDENGNACKPLNESNLHFDWSRFGALPNSLKRIPSYSTKLWKNLSFFVVLLGILVGLFLLLGGGVSFFHSFMESICIVYN